MHHTTEGWELLTQYRSMTALLVRLYQAASQQIYKNRIYSGQQTFRVNEGEARSSSLSYRRQSRASFPGLGATGFLTAHAVAHSGVGTCYGHCTFPVAALDSALWNTAACFCEDDGPVSVIGPWRCVSGALPKCRVFLAALEVSTLTSLILALKPNISYDDH